MKGQLHQVSDFRVPISDEAAVVIESAKQFERDGFLFPGVRKGVISDASMAHKVGNKVVRAYRRTDHFTERAALMERWAQHVTGAKNVIELRK